MLRCAGCSPVYSFVCAQCWPHKVCRAYYWCPGSQHFYQSTQSNTSPPSGKAKPQDQSSRGGTSESTTTRSLSSISTTNNNNNPSSRLLESPLQPTQRTTKISELQVWIKQGNKGDESWSVLNKASSSFEALSLLFTFEHSSLPRFLVLRISVSLIFYSISKPASQSATG